MKYTVVCINLYDRARPEVFSRQTEDWQEVIDFLVDDILNDLNYGNLDPDDLFDDYEDDNLIRRHLMIFRGENHEIVEYPASEVIPIVRQKLEEEEKEEERLKAEKEEKEEREELARLKAKYEK